MSQTPPVILLSICGLAFATAPAIAQDALGDGRALDANLAVGSSGRNFEGRNYSQELAYRNAIVTGNVPGGFAFRGDVGYSAANDFRGATAADDIFEFQRDAFFSGLATRGIGGISAIQSSLAYAVTGQSQGLVGDVIINSPVVGANAGEFTGSPRATRIDIYGTIGGTLRSPSAIKIQELDRPSFMNTISDANGNTIAYVGASDLLGVRPLSPQNATFGATDAQQEQDILERLREDPTLSRPLDTDDEERFGSARPAPYQQLLDALTVPIDRIDSQINTEIDGQLNTQIDPTQSQTPTTRFTPPEDPLDTVRDALRESERAANPFNRVSGDITDPSADVGDSDNPETEDAQRPKTIQERIDEAVEAAERVLGRTVSMDGLRTSSEDPIFRHHFEAGVDLLRRGRYFDAEERFSAAIQLAPGDPMAAVGRLHSQIGAGMSLSAGTNLRRLFTAYPEMMAARLDRELVPRGDRLDQIRSLLRKRMNQANIMNDDAASLLAYLGVQTGNADDVVDGLARFKELSVDPETGKPDAFASLLEAAWLAKLEPSAGDEKDDAEGTP